MYVIGCANYYNYKPINVRHVSLFGGDIFPQFPTSFSQFPCTRQPSLSHDQERWRYSCASSKAHKASSGNASGRRNRKALSTHFRMHELIGTHRLATLYCN